MTQEQLRMQMLAGIITESQYKEKMEEADSYGRVGKSYPAPSTPEPIKKINRIISDISKKKIFVGKPSGNAYYNVVYFDDKDSFYSPLEKSTKEGGEKNWCLDRVGGTEPFPRPISENPEVKPLEVNTDNLYSILAAAEPIIDLKRCPSYFNDSDGKYIWIEYNGGQGYITRGGGGPGLKRGTDYDLGMGFVLTATYSD
jgi:hypothetical protein